ncbi:MAG: PSD1 domain-containing protein, partial [Planctomycetia bacterium]|nr:PSD1 domain-containing protein [Planctomycetia bacterium]
MTCRSLLPCAVVLLASFGATARAAEPAKLDPAQVEYFEKHVRPVLVEHCLKCHGPEKQKGGLRLDSAAATKSGGDSGPAMVLGKPDESRLIKALRYEDNIQMPPNKKLPDAQIQALATWVKMGAPWPAPDTETRPVDPVRGMQVTAKDRQFWSFQPVRPVAPPDVKGFASTPIDRFLQATLEAKGLTALPTAERRTLVRRASFDLIGLPPTPDEMKAAVNDPSPEWFATVVERLLASPHYGERWARHWLDIARYGEDQAHSFQPRLYPHGYRYRDWVVKALNDDLPYDRFLMEQIAGDLLDGPNREDRLAALGFFALGPAYYGKATAEELDDRIDTLCRGMLGLTVACARCHDHKFDPIPTRDYYSLAGIFASTQYKEYPLADPATAAEYDRLQADIKTRNDAVTAFLRAEAIRMAQALSAQSAHYIRTAWVLHQQRRTNPAASVADAAKREQLHDFVLERWLNYLFPKEADQRPFLADWRTLLTGQDAAKDHSKDEAALAEVEKVAAALQEKIQALLRHGPVAEPQVATALYKEIVLGVQDIPRQQVEKLLNAEAKSKLTAQRNELENIRKKLPKLPVIHALMEGPNPANMPVYLRGNPATPGEVAPRRFLAVLAGDNSKLFTQGSGRLELARAIASKDNPLTARVLVNRVWAQHFGKGIVGTPSNFGSLGERPTHPELLDYLADRFMASGWSLKQLHRDLLATAAYQRSSQFDAYAFQTDPGNKTYWRMDRRRLEVEAWRDSLLAVSGTLDRTLGGPSADLASPDHRRRTFYAAVSRHNLDGLLRLFDFPDPNVTSEKRVVTTVPLQQLFVLNS